MLEGWNIIVGIVTSFLTYLLTSAFFTKITNEVLRTALKCLLTFIVGVVMATVKGLLFNEFTLADFWQNLPAIMTWATAFYGVVLKPSTEYTAAKNAAEAGK